MAERQTRILPTHYFHVVFTVPQLLKTVAYQNRALFFRLLFQSAAETLLTLGADAKRLGGQLGITAVLHTWTRDLKFHPHLHCVVTGGGLNDDGTRWIAARRRYLFPARVLSRLFRGKLLAALTKAWTEQRLLSPFSNAKAFNRFKDAAYKKEWVVYAKTPFGGAMQVFNYLGRYTHRVAISNQRLLGMDEQGVRFVTRRSKTATLPPDEFIGRFLQHVLPEGFVKIRHFGLLAPSNVNVRLEAARRLLLRPAAKLSPFAVMLAALFVVFSPAPQAKLLSWRERLQLLTGVDPMRCECGGIRVRQALPRNGPTILDSS